MLKATSSYSRLVTSFLFVLFVCLFAVVKEYVDNMCYLCLALGYYSFKIIGSFYFVLYFGFQFHFS